MKYFALLRQFVAYFFDSLSIFIDICSVWSLRMCFFEQFWVAEVKPKVAGGVKKNESGGMKPKALREKLINSFIYQINSPQGEK